MSVAETLAVWRRRLLIGGVVVTAVAVLLREPISDLIAVDEAWAAAATAPTAALWILLSVERGALQGVHAYKPVAWSLVLESAGRLVFGVILVAAGLGVSGAYLGTPLSFLATALGLWWVGRNRIGTAHGLARSAAPVGPRRRRVARGDRPVPDRGAAERGRDHGQAPDRRRRGRRLRGRRRRGQGRRVGGDRDRAVPAAGGHARGPPRRGPAAGADASAGRRGGGRRADADRLRGRAGDRAAARVRAGHRGRRGRAVRARLRDDAARGRLPGRAVLARAGPDRVPARAGRGRGGRDHPARRARDRFARHVRGHRARAPGRRGAVRARDRAGPEAASGGVLD